MTRNLEPEIKEKSETVKNSKGTQTARSTLKPKYYIPINSACGTKEVYPSMVNEYLGYVRVIKQIIKNRVDYHPPEARKIQPTLVYVEPSGGPQASSLTTIRRTTYNRLREQEKYSTVDLSKNAHNKDNPVSFAVWNIRLKEYFVKMEGKLAGEIIESFFACVTLKVKFPKFGGVDSFVPEKLFYDDNPESLDANKLSVSLPSGKILESGEKVTDAAIQYSATAYDEIGVSFGFLQIATSVDIKVKTLGDKKERVLSAYNTPTLDAWRNKELQLQGIYNPVYIEKNLFIENLFFEDAPSILGLSYFEPEGTSGCTVEKLSRSGLISYAANFDLYFMMKIGKEQSENNWIPIRKLTWGFSFQAECKNKEGKACGIGDGRKDFPYKNLDWEQTHYEKENFRANQEWNDNPTLLTWVGVLQDSDPDGAVASIDNYNCLVWCTP